MAKDTLEEDSFEDFDDIGFEETDLDDDFDDMNFDEGSSDDFDEPGQIDEGDPLDALDSMDQSEDTAEDFEEADLDDGSEPDLSDGKPMEGISDGISLDSTDPLMGDDKDEKSDKKKKSLLGFIIKGLLLGAILAGIVIALPMIMGDKFKIEQLSMLDPLAKYLPFGKKVVDDTNLGMDADITKNDADLKLIKEPMDKINEVKKEPMDKINEVKIDEPIAKIDKPLKKVVKKTSSLYRVRAGSCFEVSCVEEYRYMIKHNGASMVTRTRYDNIKVKEVFSKELMNLADAGTWVDKINRENNIAAKAFRKPIGKKYGVSLGYFLNDKMAMMARNNVNQLYIGQLLFETHETTQRIPKQEVFAGGFKTKYSAQQFERKLHNSSKIFSNTSIIKFK